MQCLPSDLFYMPGATIPVICDTQGVRVRQGDMRFQPVSEVADLAMITNVPSYCANPHEQTIANHCAKPHLHLKTIASPYPIALVRAWYVICDKRYLHCSDTQISHRKCRLAWHGYGLVSSQSDSSQICLCPDQRCICVDSNQNFHFLKQRKAERAVLILITGNFQCDKKPWGATD